MHGLRLRVAPWTQNGLVCASPAEYGSASRRPNASKAGAPSIGNDVALNDQPREEKV